MQQWASAKIKLGLLSLAKHETPPLPAELPGTPGMLMFTQNIFKKQQQIFTSPVWQYPE